MPTNTKNNISAILRPTSPNSSGTGKFPIHRLYHTTKGLFYTSSEHDLNQARSLGWIYQGVETLISPTAGIFTDNQG